jgi:hypothetical protein
MISINAACPFCIALLLAFATGISASEGPGPPPGQVAIMTQPVSQVVPVGRPATFTVVTAGTAPVRYQWSKNDEPILGATGSSYTTPDVTFADGGSTYQVTVSNEAGSVTSRMARLTVGPRAPAIGDLRYLLNHQVTLPGFGTGGTGEVAGVTKRLGLTFNNAIGSPLLLGSEYDCGSDDCYYPVFEYRLPPPMTGLSTFYEAGNYDGSYSDFNAMLRSSVVAPNVVIFSVDLELQPHTFGLAWVATSQPGGFDYRMEAVPASQIQATAAADGAQSRIITAVSFDQVSGSAFLISYGWRGDMTTAYDAQSVVTTKEEVSVQAASLASQGYFISAFGGDDAEGYILIGMRVHGDTMPRPIQFGSRSKGFIRASNPDNAYFTTVVDLHWLGDYALIEEQ